MNSDDEQEYTSQVATTSKKGKRSRQIVDDDGSESDHAPPAKRRTPGATKIKPHTEPAHSEPDDSGDEEVDIEGIDSDTPASRQNPRNDDDDAADTSSSRSASPDPGPTRKQQSLSKPERTSSKSKLNLIESDDEDSKSASPAPTPVAPKPPRPPIRQDSATTTTKPLRKPVAAGSRAKEREKESVLALSNIPAIPRRPKDAAVKDTQDMDLLNKDVYNQLFNTSSLSKPIAKNAQTEAKQKEINAKRQAAKSALLEARDSTFDLQLPTDKVLAFEASFDI
ncbi:hypothetical protein FRC09_019965 [Ceratobasidium sp. 395]|nr:hypothetical protein FRC09_019965 [Ceratobasidium sp. 395]